MTNKYKRRGDEAEREGVAVLRELAADLLVPGAGREFGAGRALDVGDLKMFPDVAVQVRRNPRIREAIRTSAADAVTQARNREVPLALGMVPVIGPAAHPSDGSPPAWPGRSRWNPRISLSSGTTPPPSPWSAVKTRRPCPGTSG